MNLEEGQYVIIKDINAPSDIFSRRAKIVNIFKKAGRRKIYFLYLDLHWNHMDRVSEIVLKDSSVTPIPDGFRLLKYHEVVADGDLALTHNFWEKNDKVYWRPLGRFCFGRKAYKHSFAIIRPTTVDKV